MADVLGIPDGEGSTAKEKKKKKNRRH
jgi:hypothetical protein